MRRRRLRLADRALPRRTRRPLLLHPARRARASTCVRTNALRSCGARPRAPLRLRAPPLLRPNGPLRGPPHAREGRLPVRAAPSRAGCRPMRPRPWCSGRRQPKRLPQGPMVSDPSAMYPCPRGNPVSNDSDAVYADRATGKVFENARAMADAYLQRFSERAGTNLSPLDESGYTTVRKGSAVVGINVLEDHGVLLILAPVMK